MADIISETITKINQLASISLGRIFTTSDDEELRKILIDLIESASEPDDTA